MHTCQVHYCTASDSIYLYMIVYIVYIVYRTVLVKLYSITVIQYTLHVQAGLTTVHGSRSKYILDLRSTFTERCGGAKNATNVYSRGVDHEICITRPHGRHW